MAAVGAAALVAGGLGIAVGATDLGTFVTRPADAGLIALFVCGIGGALAVRARGATFARRLGPGHQLAAVILSLAYAVGLLFGRPILGTERTAVIILAGVSVFALVAGGCGVLPLLKRSKTDLPTAAPNLRLLRQGPFRVIAAVFILMALANLATGQVPLLSSDVNAARFASTTSGAFGNLLAWIIGGLEWIAVVVGACVLVRRKVSAGACGGFVVAIAPLILFAGRSFLLVIALALVVVYASLRVVQLYRLAIAFLVGLAFLGAAGQYRAQQSEVANQTGGVAKQIFSSSGVGLSVFASTLDQIPRVIPFQSGSFFLRDLRAEFPLHPFGRPLRADFWVTEVVRQRLSSENGGSPPTFAGGFYIDFGLVGVIVGAALAGAALVWSYHWSRRRGTVGALCFYGYLSAYVALAAYSYISLKPTVLIFLALCLVLDRWERKSADRATASGETAALANV